MKIHRIKHNYRYIIYEIKDDYYLVDLYDHWWLTILFPFLGWFLYHKAYPLTKEEFKDYCVTNKKKISPLSVGGISLIVASLIVSLWDYSVYIPNIISNEKLLHALILVIFTLFFLYVYMKFNGTETGKYSDRALIKIFPCSFVTYLSGFMAYLAMLILPLCIFIMPFYSEASGYKYLLQIPFLLFSLISILMIMNMGYSYMENMGPYDYQFKNKEE